MDYTVSFLFTEDGKQVLLLKKDRTTFAGKLNGVGGKVEKFDNSNAEAAKREISEETGVPTDALLDFTWLGTLTLPWDCTHLGGCATVHFYAAITDASLVSQQSGETEELVWCSTADVVSAGASGDIYAGDGDVQYFIRQAIYYYKWDIK